MKIKMLLCVLSLFSAASGLRGQDSLYLSGDLALCLEECDVFEVAGLSPNSSYNIVWTLPSGQDILTDSPSVELCGYFFGFPGVHPISVSVGTMDMTIATIDTFIIVEELFLPEIYSSSDCGSGSSGQTGCDRVCAHSSVTYFLEAGFFIDWFVTGAESYEVDPGGQSVTVQWGEAGAGFVSAFAFSNFCFGETSLCVDILEDPAAAFETAPPAPAGGVLSICEGQSVQFQNTSQHASSFEWTFGNGQSSAEEHPQTSYFSPGTYEVTLIAYNDCFCSDTTQLTVEVQDGENPFIDCVSTICENTVQTYTSDAACGAFAWTVSSNGVILEGGGPADNFITIDWGEGPTGLIELQVADCSGGDYCLEPAVVEVPILSDNAQVEGPEQVCRGQVTTYSLPPYEGTDFNWTVSNFGTLISGQGTHEISVLWADLVTNTPQWVAVSYENCWLGCNGGDTLTVNIRPRFMASGPIEVCPGAFVVYTAQNAENGDPAPADWFLSAPGGFETPLGEGTASVNFTWPSEPGAYRLIAEPAQPADYCGERFEITVQAAELPPPPTAIEGGLVICPGATYTYRALSTETDTRFQWTVTNGGTTSTQFGNPVNVTWSDTPPYELSVVQLRTTGPGCASEPLDTTVQPLPPFIIAGPADVCQEATGVFTTAYDPAVTYEWRINPATAGTIIREADNEIEVLWHRPGAAAVELEACMQTLSFDVHVLPKPRPVVDHPTQICTNEITQVQTTQPYSDYIWRDEDGNVVSDQPGPDLGPGYFELTVVDANGCSGDTTFYINGFPESVISISTPDDTGFCPADSPSPRTLYAVNTEAGYAYQWHQDGIAIPGATGPTFSTLDFGAYYVQITDQNGCTFHSNTIVLFEFCGFTGVCNGITCTFPTDCDPGTQIQFDIQPMAVCNVRSYVNDSPDFIPGTLQWNFGDPESGANNISTLESPSHKYRKAGFYTVILTGLVLDGTDTLFCWDAQVDTVFAAAAFDYDGVCPGGEVQFNDLSTHLPFTSIAAWEWNFGDPASGAANTSADPDPTHIFQDPGTYVVSLTVTSSEGCTANTSREVVIYSPPAVSFAEPAISCEATAINFSAEVSDRVTDVFWDFGDPGSGEANGSELFDSYHAFEAPGDYTVTLTATSIYGCTNSFTRMITVASNGLAGDISLSPPSPICAGQTTTLSAPPGGAGWEWSTGATGSSITVGEAGVYEVTVTDAEGCGYTPDAAVVDVLPAPFATVRAVEFNEFLQPTAYFYSQYETCAGADVFLEAEEVPGYSYQWLNGDTDPATEFSEARSNQLGAGSHDVMLTLTDNSTGCTSQIPFNVIVHALPGPVQIETGATGILCEGNMVTLSVVNPQPDLLYVWNDGPTGPALTTQAAGDYTVRAINAFGCEVESNAITIEAGPDIRKIPGGCHTRCRPDTLCLPDLPDVVSYQWYLEGSPIPGPQGTTPDLVVDQTGQYFVELTDDQGCTLASGPLNLELLDGFGNFEGNVYFDVNDNGLIDASDSLLSGIGILLLQNGMTAGMTTSDPSGAYTFVNFPEGDYTLGVDTLLLPPHYGVYDPFRDTSLVGCGDLVNLDWLLYLDCQSDTTAVSLAACAGSTAVFGGTELNAGTTTSFTFNTVSGCDSTVLVTVEALAIDSSYLTLSVCPGGMVEYQGVALAAGEVRSFTLTNVAGCDSVVIVTVTLLPGNATNLELQTCPGQPVEYEGLLLTAGMVEEFTFVNQAGCDSVVTVTVIASPVAEVDWQTVPACAGQADGSLDLSALGGALPLQYSLDGTSFSEVDFFGDLPAGAAILYIKDANGCVSTLDFSIDQTDPLQVVVTDTILSCTDPQTTVRLELLSGDPAQVSYQWDDGFEGAERLVTSPGLYSVQVSDECSSLRLPVQVRFEREIAGDLFYVPNAFSPNGDGHNDLFAAQAGRDVQVETYQLDLFDRWGNLIFRSEAAGAGWDGKLNGSEMPAGVFVWRLEAKVRACSQPEQVELYGDVVLLR